MDRIGRYQVVRELGRGAMGVVYLADDPNIGRPVAIKTIRLGEVEKEEERERLRERLFREARSAGILSHPGIVTIYDVDQQDDLAYIAMEYVDGPTLEYVLSQETAMSPEQMFSVFGQAAAALDYAHHKGIVHRDIKPANLMIAADTTTKVTDFGVAKFIANDHLTRTGTIIGTPHFMSPEQAQGLGVDGRADQFSLAVIAYEILTGEKPFTGDNLTTVVYKIVVEEPAQPQLLNRTLAGPIDEVLRRGLAKRPEARFATCQQFTEALEKACAASTGWKTMRRGGSLTQPTALEADQEEAPQLGAPLPPPRRTRLAQANVNLEPEPAARSGFWAFLLAILVAAGLLALLGLQTVPWLAKEANPQNPTSQAQSHPPAPVPQAAEPPSARSPGAAARAPDEQAPAPVATPEVQTETSPPAAPEEPTSQKAPPEPAPERPSPFAPPDQPKAPLGRTLAGPRHPVLVVSSPGGATVTLDGRSASACQAPCSVQAEPGHHTIAVTMSGYQVEHRDVEVGTGGMELPAVILRPFGGTLLVSSEPPGASILVNGRKVPQITPAQISLAPGNYNITLEKDGKRYSRSVDVHNGVINYLKLPLDE